jgi:hypothetical protein
MPTDTVTRFVLALMEGEALTGCPKVYQIMMGMALAIYENDRKLGRPLDHFSKYLCAYAEAQDVECLARQRQGVLDVRTTGESEEGV